MLVGYCAIAQTAGKAIFGKLADFRALNRLHLTQMSLLVIAVATALLPLAQSYSALVTFCFVAGFFDGGFVTLIGLVVHEIVGRQLMAEALGTMYGVVALPMTIGPPVAGKCSCPVLCDISLCDTAEICSDLTAVGQRWSPWPCNLVKAEIKFHIQLVRRLCLS